MMRTIAIAVLFVVILGCSQQLEFAEFASPENGFQVRFPGTPQEESRDFPNKTGEQKMWSVDAHVGSFQVFAQPAPAEPARYDDIADGLAKSFQGKQLTKAEFAAQGNTGAEYEIQITEPIRAYLTTRLLYANDRFYQVQFLGNLRKDAPAVTTFLDSFKLLTKP